jgi:hypothetical protein
MLALNPLTVAALREWRERQLGERAFFERDYQDSTRVFVWEDGRPVHPDVIRQRFNRLSLRCSFPTSGYTTCITGMPPPLSRQVYISRS